MNRSIHRLTFNARGQVVPVGEKTRCARRRGGSGRIRAHATSQIEPDTDASLGGIASLQAVTLQKKDIFGHWQTVIDHKGPGALGQSVYIGAPSAAATGAAPGAQVKLMLR